MSKMKKLQMFWTNVSKLKVHNMLGCKMNIYVSTFMQIQLFQAYCKQNIGLKLKKQTGTDPPKKHYAHQKACKVFSASSTHINILIWKYVDEQIL